MDRQTGGQTARPMELITIIITNLPTMAVVSTAVLIFGGTPATQVIFALCKAPGLELGFAN